MPRWPNDPKPSEAEQRGAIPAVAHATQVTQAAADAAVEAAADVTPRVERAAERVQDAAEHLADSVKETAADLKSKSSTKLCPLCKAELIPHGDANPNKAGAYHCNGCGACWAPGIREQRAGHSGPTGA